MNDSIEAWCSNLFGDDPETGQRVLEWLQNHLSDNGEGNDQEGSEKLSETV